MQGKACLLIAPSFETLSYAHTPTSAHGLLYQLRVLVEACRLPIALTKKKREKAVCLLASITGESWGDGPEIALTTTTQMSVVKMAGQKFPNSTNFERIKIMHVGEGWSHCSSQYTTHVSWPSDLLQKTSGQHSGVEHLLRDMRKRWHWMPELLQQ